MMSSDPRVCNCTRLQVKGRAAPIFWQSTCQLHSHAHQLALSSLDSVKSGLRNLRCYGGQTVNSHAMHSHAGQLIVSKLQVGPVRPGRPACKHPIDRVLLCYTTPRCIY